VLATWHIRSQKRQVSPSIPPVRSVFSRLLTRVWQPAGRAWLSRSRRLFRLFAKCNPPCVRVWPACTSYVSVYQWGGVARGWLLNFRHPFLNQEENTTHLLRVMVHLRAPGGAPASRLACVPEPDASCEGSTLPWDTCHVKMDLEHMTDLLRPSPAQADAACSHVPL